VAGATARVGGSSARLGLRGGQRRRYAYHLLGVDGSVHVGARPGAITRTVLPHYRPLLGLVAGSEVSLPDWFI
jgi:hypothetical protein